jgi:hypothetical protein
VRNVSTMASRLALVGVLAGLCLAGWAARGTFAQNTPPEAASAPAPAPGPPGQAKPTEVQEPGSVAPAVPVESSNTTSPETTGAGKQAKDTAPPPALEDPPSAFVPVQPVQTGIPTDRIDRAAPAAEVPALDRLWRPPIARRVRGEADDDPEKEALAFAQRSQEGVESKLKNLKDEAARLRARLQKVEAGIKRWDIVLEALKRSQSGALAEEQAPQASVGEREPR